MERISNYSFMFRFPFNKETSSLYSDNEKLKIENLNHTLDMIDLVISSHKFISMETVMKYFGLRPTRYCPAVNFTQLGESQISYDEINQTDIVTITLYNEMTLRHIKKDLDPELRMAEEPIRPIPVVHPKPMIESTDEDIEEGLGDGSGRTEELIKRNKDDE